MVALGDGEAVAGLLVHPEPGPGAEQVHGSVACGALILQSILQIPIKRWSPCRRPWLPAESAAWRELSQNPIDLVDADPLEAAGRQAEHAPLLCSRCATRACKSCDRPGHLA